jgi:hypothetical protein
MESDSKIFTLGNAADYQVSKTDRTGSGTTNLVPQDPGREPYRTRTDEAGNLMTYSENILSWPSPTGVTRNSATTATFTAQNGELYQVIPVGLHETASYTFRVKLRRISGNTSLVLRTHLTDTPITIDDTLREYSTTFTATGGADTSCAVKDPNAAGFGQIEIVEAQMRKNTWASTYVATTVDPILGATAPNGLRSISFGANIRNFICYSNVTTVSPPFTLYMTVRPMPWGNFGRLFSLGGGTYNFFISMETESNGYRLYTTSGNKSVATPASFSTDYAWFVLSATVQSSGVSTIRKNLGTPISGTLGTINPGQVQNWGSNSYDGYSARMHTTDLIIRRGIQTTNQQIAHVQFLAGRVGVAL